MCAQSSIVCYDKDTDIIPRVPMELTEIIEIGKEIVKERIQWRTMKGFVKRRGGLTWEEYCRKEYELSASMIRRYTYIFQYKDIARRMGIERGSIRVIAEAIRWGIKNTEGSYKDYMKIEREKRNRATIRRAMRLLGG